MKESSPDIELARRLSATPHRVFSAFADPKTLQRWLSPSPNVGLTLLQFDFRVGGDYRFAYRLEDGATVVVGGRYLAIDPPSTIVFSWTWEAPDEHAGIESQVTILIAPDGPGAMLTIRHERLTRSDAVERHLEGWTGALARLTALLTEETEIGL
jgi:uncharacterized protein YndB with AHSA1/START domain